MVQNSLLASAWPWQTSDSGFLDSFWFGNRRTLIALLSLDGWLA